MIVLLLIRIVSFEAAEYVGLPRKFLYFNGFLLNILYGIPSVFPELSHEILFWNVISPIKTLF